MGFTASDTTACSPTATGPVISHWPAGCRPGAVKRGQRRHRKSARRQRMERLSLLRWAYDHHRDLRTRLPAAAVPHPIDRPRQLMTITALSPAPITVSVRRRYLTGIGHASPTATATTAFGRQNLEHRRPDHRADRIPGGQSRRPAGQSTVALSASHKSDQSTAANSP